jgi:hypothetical protein
LANTNIPVQPVKAGDLLQHVGRLIYQGTPLHFSRDKQSRYDDPLKNYGVLYLAFDLTTALMESVFHKHRWDRSPRTISTAEAGKRMVRLVGVTEDLRLAHITAPGVMASELGLNLGQLSSRHYGPTMRLSAYVHHNHDRYGQQYDGIYYPSRNNYPQHCVALFDRAAHKIVLQRDMELVRHRDWLSFVKDNSIRFI